MADFSPLSLADIYGKAQAVRQGRQAEEHQAYQMQQMQQQQEVRNRLSDFINPDGSIDTQRAIPTLLKVGDHQSIAALAAMDKAHKDGSAGGSADERLMSAVIQYKTKKDHGIPTSAQEDDNARMAYEHLTQPKMGPDGSIMQPRYSVGSLFDNRGGQPQPSPGAQSPYSTNPYSPTPRAVVSPGIKPTERLNKDVSDLSDTVQKNKLPQVMSSVSALNAELGKYNTDNVPGIGYAKNLPVANAFLSKEGKLMKQKSQAVANDLLNMYSGLAVTLPESERRDLEQMKNGAFDAGDFYAAWPSVVSRLNSITGNVKAGAAPEVLAEYGKRPGAMRFDPLTAADGKKKKNQTVSADPLVVDGYKFPNAAAAQAYRKAIGK